MSAILDSAYAGARALDVLIDRDDILSDIRQAVDDQSSATHVFYITAPGGMGKTFLLREALRRFQAGGQWAFDDVVAASREIDFYHSETHSVEGVTWALFQALGAMEDQFTTYLVQRDHLQRAKHNLREALRDLDVSHQQLAAAFRGDFRRLIGHKRLVIAFDTVEKIQYESDRIQHLLSLEEESGVEIRAWLLDFLSGELPNAVILLAGRPHERLLKELKARLGTRLRVHPLREFQEADTLEYFEAIAVTSDDIAQRLKAIPEDTRKVIHLYTGGRPILLALTIDYLIASDQLLPDLLVPLEDARAIARDGAKLRDIQERLEADIVRLLQELGRPSDEIIRSLAWTPKGIDADLLSRISGLSLEETQVGLESVKRMSFVKVRHGDETEESRVFLHDEMYDLLKRHVLHRLPEQRIEEVHRAIESYYAAKIDRARARVIQLEREGRGYVSSDQRIIWADRFENRKSLEELSRAESQLDKLMVEDVSYRLKHHPKQGFDIYRDYADIAFESNDFTLDMQLRDELLTFVNTQLVTADRFDGLERRVVELDAAFRWIKRYLMSARYAKAHELADQIRKGFPDLLIKESARQEIDIWDGWALTYLAQHLDDAESRLRFSLADLATINIPKMKILLARGHNILGFLLRSRGRFQEAIGHYLESTHRWHELGPRFDAEYANTLNNLAWARTEIGDYEQALRDCRRGLELRRELGPLYPVALSHNTMGMIHIRADNPSDGRIHCEHALYIFRELNMPRGVGLAETALAEAIRRTSTNDLTLYYPEQIIDLLRQAQRFALDAAAIFEAGGRAPEPLRLIEALIELGCVYRDWAWLRPQDTRPLDNNPESENYNPSREELAQRGKETLNRAAKIAHNKELPHRAIDILVNLAWLYFYVEDIPAAQRTLAKAKAIAPPEYHFTTRRTFSRPKDPTGWFWVQLGKAHVLEGNIAMREYREQKSIAKLRRAVQEYTLALAYNDLYGQRFRDRKRGEEHIHRQLGDPSSKELSIIQQTIEKTAQTYHLKSPVSMLKFLRNSFGINMPARSKKAKAA